MKLLLALLPVLLSGCILATTSVPRSTSKMGYETPTPGYFDEDGDYHPGIPAPVRKATWGMVTPGVTFNAASFVDYNSGWVVGGVNALTGKAAIRHTTNAGATWATQDRGINDLRAVQFLNENIGYVGGDRGVLFRTDNGGSAWTLQDTGTNGTIVGVAFLNLTDGLFLTTSDGVFLTTDGGVTWSPKGTVPDARGLTMLANGDALIASSAAVYQLSGGVLTRLDYPTGYPSQIAVADPANRSGWSVGSLGTLFSTTDGGATWGAVRRLVTDDEFVIGFTASAVAFSSLEDGMILADRRTFATHDGGTTWKRETVRISFTKCAKYFKLFDATHGWAFGDGDSLYRLGI